MTDGSAFPSEPPPGPPTRTTGEVAPLSRREERRRRVVDAAMALAAEGGYDAVQMRDVAARSEVALGTIYRYFDGKDHILAVAMIEFTSELEAGVGVHPLEGATIADRLVDAIGRVTAVMRNREPEAAAAFRALTRPDPRIGLCAQELLAVMDRIQATAFPSGYDPEARARILQVVNRVWFSSLLTWVNGWASLDDATAEVAGAIRTVLAPGC